jgi:hypothetical protein
MPDNELPSIDPAIIPIVDPDAEQEERTFAEKSEQLDLHLRRGAGYGALIAAGILYCVGVFLAIKFACTAQAQAPSWHIVIAILIALFTVPTVLALAVLRSVSLMTKDAKADSLHAIIGEKLSTLIDKLIDKLANTISSK